MTVAQRIWLLAGFLAGFALAIVLHAGDASARTPLQVANLAFPTSPCHNQRVKIQRAKGTRCAMQAGVFVVPQPTSLTDHQPQKRNKHVRI